MTQMTRIKKDLNIIFQILVFGPRHLRHLRHPRLTDANAPIRN